MDAANEEILAQRQPLAPDSEALLAELRTGLDALRSLLSEIDAREQQLRVEALGSILSQLDKLKNQDGGG